MGGDSEERTDRFARASRLGYRRQALLSSQDAAAALWLLFSSTAYSSRFASTIIVKQIEHVGDVRDVYFRPMREVRCLYLTVVDEGPLSSLSAPVDSGPR